MTPFNRFASLTILALVVAALAPAKPAQAKAHHVSKTLQRIGAEARRYGFHYETSGTPKKARRGDVFAQALPVLPPGVYGIALAGCKDAGPMELVVATTSGEVVTRKTVYQGGFVSFGVKSTTGAVLYVVTGRPRRRGDPYYHVGYALMYAPTPAAPADAPVPTRRRL